MPRRKSDNRPGWAVGKRAAVSPLAPLNKPAAPPGLPKHLQAEAWAIVMAIYAGDITEEQGQEMFRELFSRGA